ncbi:MAG: PilZ domain-containing protein [Gemmatimonadota bacterium]|nr:PilZ domain-containing protein [Gemmatimonadota bacterium]
MMDKKKGRISDRSDMELDVEYSILSGTGDFKVIKSRTLDFSLKGAKIETEEELKPRAQLTVRIEVPDLDVFSIDEKGKKVYQKTAVMCYGRVKWVKPVEGVGYNAGIRFFGMQTRDVNYLEKLIEEKSLDTWVKMFQGDIDI